MITFKFISSGVFLYFILFKAWDFGHLKNKWKNFYKERCFPIYISKIDLELITEVIIHVNDKKIERINLTEGAKQKYK